MGRDEGLGRVETLPYGPIFSVCIDHTENLGLSAVFSNAPVRRLREGLFRSGWIATGNRGLQNPLRSATPSLNLPGPEFAAITPKTQNVGEGLDPPSTCQVQSLQQSHRKSRT